MTPAEVLDLTLAKADPLPPFAAIDLVMTHRDVDVTDAVYELFAAAADRLKASLGQCPGSLVGKFGVAPARIEGVELLREAWQFADGIVSRIRGNYVSHREVATLRERLRKVPGLNVTGISGSIAKIAIERWANEADRLCRVLEEVENVESEVLNPGR